MRKPKQGDRVKVCYKVTFQDGKPFDESHEKDPLEITLGEEKIIPGFEKAIMDLRPGEKKTVSIPPEDGYGVYRNDLLLEIEKSDIPENNIPEVGSKLQLKSPQGEMTNVIVTNITDDKIILDANHPLAGKELTFEIELVEIV